MTQNDKNHESNLDFDSDSLEDEKPAGESEFAKLFAEQSSKSTAGAKKLKPGAKVQGEILVAGKEFVFVSINVGGASKDGQVPRRDLLNAQGEFPYKVGDVIDLYVTQMKGTEITLSPKVAAVSMGADLTDAYENKLAIEGKVAEVCKGGVRVLIKGKMAFCPISQLDSRHIETADEYVGKKFDFMITQVTEGGRNIVVSRRRLMDQQQQASSGSFLTEHKAGDIVRAKVMRLEKFGAFAELAPGLDGLIHISELSWSRVADSSEVVAVGQEVSVKILKIEKIEGRLKISLSIKQAGSEPWDNIPSNIKEGEIIEGKVTRCAKFGAFVEIAPGLEGLIPLSEMSYTQRVMQSDEIVHEGEKVLVKIKEIIKDTRRISLSLKDAGEDPWSLVPTLFPRGTVVQGKVEKRESFGLFIRLREGVVGLLPKTKALEGTDFPFDKLRVGDEVKVQVMEVRLSERRISLQPPGEMGGDDWKGFTASETSSSSGFGTLGDQLRKAAEKKKK